MNDSPLFTHQELMARFIIDKGGSGALFADPGTGKTRTAIEIFMQLRKTVPNLKMIVVSPLSILDAAWGMDIKKFSHFTYQNLHDDGVPDAFLTDIWLINYESLILDRKFKKLHSILYKYPVMLVCDESSRMKNHNAKTTKCLITLRDHAKYRIVMSGTPAPNTPLEYWGQMTFVNKNIFHPSFFAFRNTYFHLARGSQKFEGQGRVISREAMREMLRTGWKYDITDFNRMKLMDRIKPYAYWIKKEDCLDLPDTIDEIRSVELGSVQRKAYNEMKRHLITEIKGADIIAQVALTKLMKLREITSGFAFDGAGTAHSLGESPKLREVEHLAEEMGKRPVIFWAQFRWEIGELVSLLSKFGSVATLCSDTQDRNDSITRFQDGSVQYLVAHPRSAAHGLTFVNCSYETFFSLDYSYEAYEQARARIHRAGQVNKCTYLHLLAKDTIDEDIMAVLERKESADDLVYKMIGQKEVCV